jgi:hypothetical protein
MRLRPRSADYPGHVAVSSAPGEAVYTPPLPFEAAVSGLSHSRIRVTALVSPRVCRLWDLCRSRMCVADQIAVDPGNEWGPSAPLLNQGFAGGGPEL